MDKTQEEIQFLGFLSMCAESIKIISSCKKIFIQLTITLILPLLLVFYSHDNFFDALSINYIEYWVIEASYFSFLIVFSLLSTSIVVYTVACVYIYSHNQTTYAMVMSFVPKVWNKLMTTLLCNLAVFVVYNFVCVTLVIFLSLSSFCVMRITLYIFYFVGFVYIIIIWQLASMICVLEDIYGFEAIAKSKAVMMGRVGVTVAIFLEANVCLGCIHFLIEKFVVLDEPFVVVGKVGIGGLFMVLRSLVFLFGIVVQTVVYFVFESSINTATNHRDVYLGDYVPLESRDVKIEHV